MNEESSNNHAQLRELCSLDTAESLAILQHKLPPSPSSDLERSNIHSVSPLSIRVSLHRTRLALVVASVVSIVVALTLVVATGTELERFERRSVSVDEQQQLLDRYNSYSGNAASAIGRPLEIFVAIMVQVVMLWVMADAVLTVETTWSAKLATLGMGAIIGFLLTNSLNALNVQVRQLPIQMVMSASDLGVEANITGSSSMDVSFSEKAPDNPTVNTILRNLMLPRATREEIQCTSSGLMDDDSVVFGMPQRSWMKDLIPNALASKSITIDFKATGSSGNARDFPMNASVAADLLIAGMYTGATYAPWSVATPFVNGNSSLKAYPMSAASPTRDAPTARLAGLLPPGPASTETEDREWFVAHSAAFIRVASDDSRQNESLLSWTMEVSRVNITDAVWVDAVTLEREWVPMHLPMTTINGTRYYQRERTSPGASPAHVFIRRDSYDYDALIDAFAVCMNNNGTDTIHSTLQHDKLIGDSSVVCANKSTTSFYFFSSGKRLVADTLFENTTLNASGLFPSEYVVDSVVANLRVIYSATFARINWQLQNLSEVYGASCQDEGGCMGLSADLPGSNQKLLMKAAALPLDQVSLISLRPLTYIAPQLPLSIVSVRRPTEIKYVKYPAGLEGYWFGDILLPHNIRNLSVDRSRSISGRDCTAALENRAQVYVNNHIYMETTLQATYTAAAFFIFQNAIAKDVVSMPTDEGHMVIKLDHNIQHMSVWLSVPKLNAKLTVIGCILLVAVLLCALAMERVSGSAVDSTHNITSPHVIARVLVDDTTFPSVLLKRRVALNDVETEADAVVINALRLQSASTKTESERDTVLQVAV